jgi:hypothetical protein
MWQGRRGLWIEFGIWLLIVTGAFAMTFQFDDPIQGYRYGATAWPRAIILAIAVIAVVQFLVRIRKASARRDTVSEAPAPGPSEAGDRKSVVKVILAFGLPLVYLMCLPRTGFYLTTPVFLLAYLTLLGERDLRRLLLVTVTIYVIMIVIFTSTFYVPLPIGNWPVFYDINNWLLESFR